MIRAAGPDLIQGEFDPREHCYVFCAQRDSLTGTALSTAVGDCVHNFRAALDYLVWELAPADVRSGKGASGLEFPIFTDAVAYDRQAPRKIGTPV